MVQIVKKSKSHSNAHLPKASSPSSMKDSPNGPLQQNFQPTPDTDSSIYICFESLPFVIFGVSYSISRKRCLLFLEKLA